MKTTSKSALILQAALLLLPCGSAKSATAVAPSPSYTFTGRVMDARHSAFGDTRPATITAKSVNSSGGKVLASVATFFKEDARRNYSLPIPMATAEADGFAENGDGLEITVEAEGRTWSGVVPGAAAGVPGGVCEVDIVLAEDDDGDGIDDALFDELKAQWEDSDYWVRGETFDPNKDYDGDGISTIAEAFAGTDPFNASDVLRITAFSRSGTVELSFEGVEGRSYTVEEATDLKNTDWKESEFSIPPREGKARAVSFKQSTGRTSTTIYLMPTSANGAFYRVRAL